MRTSLILTGTVLVLTLLGTAPGASAAGCCLTVYNSGFDGVSVQGNAVLYLNGQELFRANQVAVDVSKNYNGISKQAGASPDCDSYVTHQYDESVTGSIQGKGDSTTDIFAWNWLGLTFTTSGEVISHGSASVGVVGFTMDVPESQWVAAPGMDVTALIVAAVMQFVPIPEDVDEFVELILNSIQAGGELTATAYAVGSGPVIQSQYTAAC